MRAVIVVDDQPVAIVQVQDEIVQAGEWIVTLGKKTKLSMFFMRHHCPGVMKGTEYRFASVHPRTEIDAQIVWAGLSAANPTTFKVSKQHRAAFVETFRVAMGISKVFRHGD